MPLLTLIPVASFKVCLYLDNRLDNLFEADSVLQKRWRAAKTASSNSLRLISGGGNTGSSLNVAKITAGLVRSSSTSFSASSSSSAALISNASARSITSALNRAGKLPWLLVYYSMAMKSSGSRFHYPSSSEAEFTFKPRPPCDWEAERTSQHQCTVLSTAFFIVEQFSPLISTNDSTAIGHLITRLIKHLVRLAGALLRDTERDFTPPARLVEVKFLEMIMLM